jgi:hypothetical protein
LWQLRRGSCCCAAATQPGQPVLLNNSHSSISVISLQQACLTLLKTHTQIPPTILQPIGSHIAYPGMCTIVHFLAQHSQLCLTAPPLTSHPAKPLP